jgi:hypothetical protein
VGMEVKSWIIPWHLDASCKIRVFGTQLNYRECTTSISPQFHFKFDPTFITVDPKHGNILPTIKWKGEPQFEKSNDTIERKKDNTMIKILKDTYINKVENKDSERQNSSILEEGGLDIPNIYLVEEQLNDNGNN